MNKKVFISYSHEDKKYLATLHKHLAMLKREGIISVWTDKEILVGEDIEKEISLSLESCDIFIALVSADYLDSEYCYDIEFKKALELKSNGKIIIIPIIVSRCDWQNSKFGGMKAIPEDGKAIMGSKNKNAIFNDIVKEIRRLIKKMNSKQDEYISENETRKIEYRPIVDFEKDLSSDRNFIRADYTKKILNNHRKGIHKMTQYKSSVPFVIFLCGPCEPRGFTCPNPAQKLRKKLQKVFKKDKGFKVILGEDDGLEDTRLNFGINAQDNELIFIEGECDAIIIIPSSPGSFCELGLFSWHVANKKGCLNNVTPKLQFIVLVDEKYENEKSYLMEGPIKSIGLSGHVYYINYKTYDVEILKDIFNQLRYFQI